MTIKATGANFEIFCSNYGTKSQQIKDSCLAKVGTTSQEEIIAEYNKKIKELKQMSFDVVPEEWKNLASKPDKTPEDFAKLDKMYKDAFKNLGESYAKHIDSNYGTAKDNKLSLNEFLASEGKDADKTETTNEFNILDLDGDTFVDGKELAALFCMFDMDTDNGGVNGSLKYNDIFVNQLHLVANPNSKTGIQMKNALKSAYNFLFGN